MRVLITGIEGFVGGYLAELLLGQGAELQGIVWSRAQADVLPHLADQVEVHECDLRDAGAVRRIVTAARPDAMVHLAAVSSVSASFKDPQTTFDVNVIGSANLLDAARALPSPPRMLMIGSSEQYGPVADGQPLSEERALNPRNPYAVSKAAQEMLALTYAAAYQLPLVCARPFTHFGPRQGPDFVSASFAKQVAELERNGGGAMKVGNLEAERDFSDVRDVVQAYSQLLESGRPGEAYNVCSERAVPIRSILDTIVSLSTAEVTVEQDPDRRRPSDVARFVGSAAKLRSDTGWRPTIPLEQSLQDILHYWRGQVARQ